MMIRWIIGALLCVALATFSLDLVGADDVVSDHEADRVVGGLCDYWDEGYCYGPGSGCSGYGYFNATSETTMYGEGRDGNVCGGCAGTVASSVTGCGSSSGSSS